ncbi:Uncharacterised protein [uncultured archaeon]|nr:Uncharacterised protein [uncultured archaeon]
MGVRGTDVTREVADIILLDDNFSTIVNAIREGRRVYDYMKRSINAQLASNYGELVLVMSALLFLLPLPFLPLTILWINLITDSLPCLALGIEKEEPGIMNRKPINHNNNILHGISKFLVISSFFTFAVTIGFFLLFYQTDLEKARTMALVAAVFSEMFIIISCRSEERNIWEIGFFSNKLLNFSIVIAFLLQLVAIYTPLSGILGLKVISLGELLLVLGASSLGFIFFELTKFFKIKI